MAKKTFRFLPYLAYFVYLCTSMKIGYDAKRYYHNNTGLGNYSRTLVRDMSEQFSDVQPVLYDASSFERTFQLGRRAKAEGCQLYHGLSNELPRDILRAGIPSIVTMHDVAWRTFPDMYTTIDRHIYDWKYGWSARHATHVVCISESTKRDVMHFYGIPEERISVIFQPVHTYYYNRMPSELAEQYVRELLPFYRDGERRYIITVGSINSRKNLLAMVQALNNVPAAERPHFVVIGNGREYRRKVEKYIADNGLQKWVHIISGMNDVTTLQALYSKALLLMYPSFYEGFGLPVVEAALQNCPVITSNVSSLPEAAGPGAVQVDPASVDQLTEALVRLLNDENERRVRGRNGYDYCTAHFSPERLTTQMHELYERIINK